MVVTRIHVGSIRFQYQIVKRDAGRYRFPSVNIGSGRSVAWLARLFRVQEVVSSNLTAPTTSLIYDFRFAIYDGRV